MTTSNIERTVRDVLVVLVVVLMTASVIAPAVAFAPRVEHGQPLDTSGETTTNDSAAETNPADINLGVTVGNNGTIRERLIYGSNDTVPIVGSAVTGSSEGPSAAGGLDVTFAVTLPNGTVETFNRRTNSSGTATVTFSLEDRPNGRYEVSIEAPNASSSASSGFSAGPMTKIYPGRGSTLEVNRSTQVAALVVDGDRPLAGVTRNLTIVYPNQTSTVEEVTTGSDGFATLEFTPTQPGRYTINPLAPQSPGTSLIAGDVLTQLRVNGDEFGGQLNPTQTVHFTGHLIDDTAPAADRNLTVRIINRSAPYPSEIVTNLTTTTDGVGQYAVSWQTPDLPGRFYDYEARLYANGTRVAGGSNFFRVESPPGGGDGTVPTLDVTTGFDTPTFERLIRPGTNATATVTVTNDTDPVSGASVSYALGYRGDGAVLRTGTVTTDATGETVIEVPVPANAPTGRNIQLETSVTVNGMAARDTAYGVLQEYLIEEQESRFAPIGGTIGYEFSANDPYSETGVEDVPVTVAASYQDRLHTSVFDTSRNDTAANGNAQFGFVVPNNATEQLTFRPSYRYGSSFDEESIPAVGYPTRINGIDSFERAPGDTLNFNYTVESDARTNGTVVVSTFDTQSVDEPVLVAQQVAPGEQVTATLPEVEGEVIFEVSARTVNETGFTSVAREYIRVNGSGISEGSGDRVNVTGRVLDSGGNAAANDTIMAFAREASGEPTVVAGTLTDEAGNFSLTVPKNDTYDVAYIQGSQAGGDLLQQDGIPDLFALAEVSVGNADASIGTEQLPQGYDLNVSVVDESGNAVENAGVGYIHTPNGSIDSRPVAMLDPFTTNADGLADVSGEANVSRTVPGMEVNGSVTMVVVPPDGDNRFVNRSYTRNVTVTGDDRVEVTLNETVAEISSRVVDSNGRAAANDTIIAFASEDDGEPTSIEDTRTNESGYFSLTVPKNDTYDIAYIQGSTTGGDLLSQDGTPDLFALTEVSVGVRDETLATQRLERGYDLNVSVVDESGDPVENAGVGHIHTPNGSIDSSPIAVLDPFTTNADGLADVSGEANVSRTVPGLELNGSVTVVVVPPDGDNRFVNRSYTRNVTVTADEGIEVTLAEETTCINRAVAGSDGKISLSEIQDAINWWAEDTEVPDTGGQTISLSKIQDLINAWAEDIAVSCKG